MKPKTLIAIISFQILGLVVFRHVFPTDKMKEKKEIRKQKRESKDCKTKVI